MDIFPRDILFRIFSGLCWRNILFLSRVCKNFYRIYSELTNQPAKFELIPEIKQNYKKKDYTGFRFEIKKYIFN